MAAVCTTKMTARGQITIPQQVRKDLGLEAGTRFIVITDGDGMILKEIEPPSLDSFDELTRRARQSAKAAGLKRSDIAKAIAEVRAES